MRGKGRVEKFLWERLQEAQDPLAECVRHVIMEPSDLQAVARLSDVIDKSWSNLSKMQTLR